MAKKILLLLFISLNIHPVLSAQGEDSVIIFESDIDLKEDAPALVGLVALVQQVIYYLWAPFVGGVLIFTGLKKLSNARDEEKESCYRRIAIGAIITVVVPLLTVIYKLVSTAASGT